MVAAVSYRGETLWSKGYGVIDKKSTTVPSSDTIFRVGSISKVFAVSAIIKCAMPRLCSCIYVHVFV